MSYTIMYGRQFVKTSRGVIPLALYGSNNLTVSAGSDKGKVFHYWSIYAREGVEFTPEEYMDMVNSWCGKGNQQHFKMHGRWIDDNGLIAWAKNGIKKAATVEEIKRHFPEQILEGHICIFDNVSYNSKHVNQAYFSSTVALETWIDEAYVRVKELAAEKPDSTVIIEVCFFGRDSFAVIK